MSGGRVTLAQVAKAAGVSVTTAGEALRDIPRVSQETKRIVREVAARLGYRAHHDASRMRGEYRPSVAVVMHQPMFAELSISTEWFYGRFLFQLARALSERGFGMALAYPNKHRALPACGAVMTFPEDLDNYRLEDVPFGAPIWIGGPHRELPRFGDLQARFAGHNYLDVAESVLRVEELSRSEQLFLVLGDRRNPAHAFLRDAFEQAAANMGRVAPQCLELSKVSRSLREELIHVTRDQSAAIIGFDLAPESFVRAANDDALASLPFFFLAEGIRNVPSKRFIPYLSWQPDQAAMQLANHCADVLEHQAEPQNVTFEYSITLSG